MKFLNELKKNAARGGNTLLRMEKELPCGVIDAIEFAKGPLTMVRFRHPSVVTSMIQGSTAENQESSAGITLSGTEPA